MEGGDPDAPTHKRQCLGSANSSLYNNGTLPPPQPLQAQPSRHPSHPTLAQASSPPPNRHYPPHSLPPPSQAYPPQGPAHFPGPHPSPSLPPSDIRAYSDPRNIPSPGQRPHGLPGPPVTLPARNIPQDSISTYRPPPTPQSTAAPEPHSSRSTSVSVDIKPSPQPPPMEHGSHPGPWPVNPEQRHSSSISNGYNQAISPPNPNEPPFQTPPMPQSQHYGQSVGTYASSPYIGQYSAQTQQMRRKQVRATQACNHCRSRKQKCDEARPCQFCKENNYDCQYKDVPPPKQDRSMMQLQESVNKMSDVLDILVEEFKGWKQSMEVWKQSVEQRFQRNRSSEAMAISNHPSPDQGFGPGAYTRPQSASRMPTPVQARTQLQRVNGMKTESPVVPHSNISPVPAHASTPIKQEGIISAPQPPATPAESVRTDQTQNTTNMLKQKTGLQSDHTTPAHQLLEVWPSMLNFCDGIERLQRLKLNGYPVSDYPMQFEQERGLIRVWGVGQGQDRNDGAQGPASPESQVDSDAPSPVPEKEGIWGCPPVDHSSPSTMSGDTPRDHPGHYGGLGPDGRPNFHTRTLWHLHDLYLQHIHSLHPFLNPSKLRRMIKDFSDTYSPDTRATSVLSPASAMSNHLNPGVKRKRSSSVFGDSYSPAQDLSKGGIERSLRNAIVLLVLALGKVCEHTNPLPAPQSDRTSMNNGAWGYTRSSPHSSGGSFSTEDGEHRPRNIDILPGMAYYSYATDILGNQQGGNTVAHAQAMLLAALYLGQFARVLESWSWINNACRICLVLIKADMPKINRQAFFDRNHLGSDPQDDKEQYRLNLVKCVYWTCLQLESDILAEMSSLPPTEISQHQETITYPSGVFEKFPDTNYDETSEHEKTMWIYSSQIHLRVILNEAHNTLYSSQSTRGPNGQSTGSRKNGTAFDSSNVKEVANAARVHADILLSWRRLLPASLAWEDSDPPSTDINIARLRAKYYGGHYMILRPFLYIACHDFELPPKGPTPTWSSQHNSPTADGGAGTPTNKGMFGGLVDLTADQSSVLHTAHYCICSAIQSTIAFDRVGADPNMEYKDYVPQRKARLILTNIFGTLHAQFGNMIILAAVFKSRLHHHLPRDTPLTRSNLIALFRRTRAILSEVAPNSPILQMDLEILQNVQQRLNLEQPA